MENTKIDIAELSSELRSNWGWLLTLGILLVILGCIGLGMVVGLTLASMLLLGVLFVIAGILQIIDAFKAKFWKTVAWHAFAAVLYIIGGCLIMYDPFLASTIITALLAGVLIIIGLTRFIMAIQLRHTRGWGWLLFAGIIAIALGVMILLHWPISGLWVIGLFIAVEMIVDGWTYIFLAFAIRQAPAIHV
jgi:uncharacterized membrane protein HdeD (DUF308 family)